jgi:hypothetical protein
MMPDNFTHYILADNSYSFTPIWSGSFGTPVQTIQVDISGNMYVTGNGTSFTQPNQTYVRLYDSAGGDITNFLVNTGSLGISHNDATSMVVDNSQSIFVANRRVLKYLSGSYTTPIWSSSLITPAQNIMEMKLDGSGNIYTFGITNRSTATSSRSFLDFHYYASQSNQIVKWDRTIANEYTASWSGSFIPSTVLTPLNLMVHSEGSAFTSFGYYTSSLGASSGGNVVPFTTVFDVTSSYEGPDGVVYNAVLIKPKSTTRKTTFNFSRPGPFAVVRIGSLVVSSIWIKPSSSLDNSTPTYSTKGFNLSPASTSAVEIYFGNATSNGGKRVDLQTGSNFTSDGRFITSSTTTGTKLEYGQNGWQRIVTAYYVSASTATNQQFSYHGQIFSTGMDLYYGGAQIESSSAANTSSALISASDYVPNFGRTVTTIRDTVWTGGATSFITGSAPQAGRWSMVVDKNQNMYISGPSPSGSNNVSIVKWAYQSGQSGQAKYTISHQYSSSATTINCGLALYETDSESLLFQIVRGNSIGTSASSSINVINTSDLTLSASFAHSSSIKPADTLSHIQISPQKNIYVVTEQPSTFYVYQWNGVDGWNKQSYTYTFNNKINTF